MEQKKNTWDILSKINCNDKTEKKNGLTYLSWAWAWGIVKKEYPSANYKVVNYDSKPFLFDENLGYLVTTEVTIDGESISMNLPVMDGANKAQKHIDYEYETKFGKKKAIAATMFDINTAIMRCLTKNLAMFGLGHYIYAGEDLPSLDKNQDFTDAIELLKKCKTREELNDLFSLYKNNKEVEKLILKRGIDLGFKKGEENAN
jgi:hypothetical protein